MTLILLVNSDLSLKIDENNLSAHPMTDDGFAMMWAGVRANYGITKELTLPIPNFPVKFC
jgi:hypothetical protein